MTGVVDDKSGICIPFILRRLETHRQRYVGVENAPPLFLGINGVQGAGKSTLVRELAVMHQSSQGFLDNSFTRVEAKNWPSGS